MCQSSSHCRLGQTKRQEVASPDLVSRSGPSTARTQSTPLPSNSHPSQSIGCKDLQTAIDKKQIPAFSPVTGRSCWHEFFRTAGRGNDSYTASACLLAPCFSACFKNVIRQGACSALLRRYVPISLAVFLKGGSQNGRAPSQQPDLVSLQVPRPVV